MSDLRTAIIAEIMKLVRPPRVALDYKPSIAELETLMSDDDSGVRIEPDGTVTLPDRRPRTVGDIADAVLRLLDGQRAERAQLANAVRSLAGKLDGVNGEIDRETAHEFLAADYDPPLDREFTVTLTAKQIRDVNDVVLSLDQLAKDVDPRKIDRRKGREAHIPTPNRRTATVDRRGNEPIF